MIVLDNIHATLGGKPVLKGLSLEVAKGESMVVIGASGSGKSVMLKCILGLMEPQAGTISVDGATVTGTDRQTFLPRFGMLFQGAALFDGLRVWENVAFRPLHDGMVRPEARALALEKLERVGLPPETADLYPAELSGGMQKRAGLARAIAADPEILFLDEPTTGLDPIMAEKINALLRQLIDETGVTSITITHDMASARVIADRVAYLQDGAIAWTGGKSEMSKADHPGLRAFLSAAIEGH